MILKQSTAYTRMFKMIDSADHFSKKTGLTCTVNLSKAGAAFGAAGGTITEVANGWYKIALTTTDTNTVGDLAYYITATGADDTDFADTVSVRLIDDAAFPATSGRSMVVDASGLVDANVVKVGPTGSGTAQTARDIGASVLLSTGTGTGQLDFTSGVVKANATQILGGTIPAVTTTGVPKVDVQNWTGTAVTTPDTAGSPKVTVTAGSGAGQLDFTSGVVKANATQLVGGTIPAPNVTGVPLVDLKYTLGTISPATAGSVRADAVTGAVGSVTGNVGGSVASLTTNNDKTGYSLAAGQLFIKKNTGLNNFMFLMLDSTDHVSPKTGLTVAGQVSIDGAAFTNLTNAISELANGIYKVNLAAADVNGSVLVIKFTSAGADNRYVTIVTQT